MPPKVKDEEKVTQHGLDPDNDDSSKIGIYKGKSSIPLLTCSLLFTGKVKDDDSDFTGLAGVAYFKARGRNSTHPDPGKPNKVPFAIFEDHIKSSQYLRKALKADFPNNNVVCNLSATDLREIMDRELLENKELKEFKLAQHLGVTIDDASDIIYFFNGMEKLQIYPHGVFPRKNI